MFRAKIKATLLHGIITLVVAVLTAFTIYGLWYPGEFASMLEGTNLFRLIMGVELVVGPLMSLVIYSPYKRRGELIRDYSFIGIVQLSALLYGLYVIALSRPVYLVFVKDRIEIVAAAELAEQDLREGAEDFRHLPLLGPQLICTESPKDAKEKSDLLFSALNGRDIQLLPKYYRRCQNDEIISNAFPKRLHKGLISSDVSALPTVAGKDSIFWLPAVTRFGNWTVVFSKGNLDDAVYLNLDPFEG